MRLPRSAPGWMRNALAVATAAAVAMLPSIAHADDDARAARAHNLILELELDRASRLLEPLPNDEPSLALEMGRMLLYATDYDRAVEVFDRPDVARTPEGARLGALAHDCARTMAGSVGVRDDEHGVMVRLQDDHDRALVPFIGQVAQLARRALARDLGVELPIPVRIEVVRDHFALAAITGLPEQSARTTGTVAVANWGRVAMISPRATPDGYPWMDTLAHEMTHLAIARGTRDRAPLWFQEGVAKRQETRWREPDPSDDYPSPDSVAAVGFDRGLAREFTNLGPSIAMLPSPQHAMVAFAEVQSFVNTWLREAGTDALPNVLAAMRDSEEHDANQAIALATGTELADWKKRWLTWLALAPRQLPEEIQIGTSPATGHAKAARLVRLAQLLAARSHAQAAIEELEPAQTLVPSDLRIRAMLGNAYRVVQRDSDAWRQVENIARTLAPHAEAFALRGWLLSERGDQAGAQTAFLKALSIDPWKEAVACEMLPSPRLPADVNRATLCEDARKWRYDVP